MTPSPKIRWTALAVLALLPLAIFAKDVNTIYDNSSAGKDRPYIESNRGKLIDAKGVKGRYVRLYSNGNTTNKMNDYIEVEVWGKLAA